MKESTRPIVFAFCGMLVSCASWGALSTCVTFKPNGGEGSMPSVLLSVSDANRMYVFPTCRYFRSGWEFCGWTLSANCHDTSDQLYQPGDSLDLLSYLATDCQENLTLRAQWMSLPANAPRNIRHAHQDALDEEWAWRWTQADLGLRSLGDSKYICPVLVDEGDDIYSLIKVKTSSSGNNGIYLPSVGNSRDGYVFDGWDVYDACCLAQPYYSYKGEYYIGGYIGRFPEGYFYGVCGTTALVATWRKAVPSDIDAPPASFAASQTLGGALCENGIPIGIVQVKVGKLNRKGLVRMSGSVMPLGGRKKTFKSVSADGTTGSIRTAMTVAGSGEAMIVVDGNGLSGSYGGYEIRPAVIGGLLNRTASFDFGAIPVEYPVGDSVFSLIETMYDQNWNEMTVYLSEPVYMNGKKWSCNKAASVKWQKCRCVKVDGSWACPDCYGEWKVDMSRGRTNLSALKLNYNAKAGTFKGSFKVYAEYDKGLIQTVSVSGIVVDGVGYGIAELKKPLRTSWRVNVR